MTIKMDLLPHRPKPKTNRQRIRRFLESALEATCKAFISIVMILFWLSMCCLPSAILYVLLYRL